MKLTMATLLPPALLVAFTAMAAAAETQNRPTISGSDQEHYFGAPISAGGHDELGPGPVQERQGTAATDGRAVAVYHRHSFRTLPRKFDVTGLEYQCSRTD